MKAKISKDELMEHFAEQIDFLESSATSYDNGFIGEIKRLAVSVRVLVNDTKSSTSLLSLLKRKDIKFHDTSEPFEESNIGTHSGLVQISLGKRASKPLPLLDGGPFKRMISFESWWNGIVFVDKKRNEFSRKDIVLTLANKEGGAHVDGSLDQKYADLRKNNSLSWYDVSPDGKETPSADQVPASMRQIAHEVLKTIKKDYSCHRETQQEDEIFVMGGSIVEGSSAPPTPSHNLPKNRPIVAGKKIGRNEACPCGSGKKYKKCCIN